MADRRRLPTGPQCRPTHLARPPAPRRERWWPARPVCSQSEFLQHSLAVEGRVSEQHLAALGTAEVQVRRVLPGEPDPTVNLNVLGRNTPVRLRAVCLRQAGQCGGLDGVLIDGLTDRVRRGRGTL